ncbi:MAG: PH domain-containing protein [Deltaproteobacteria bacterium]|nr:PH domain-containing protein [Deltaproteobacteria bacterium]
MTENEDETTGVRELRPLPHFRYGPAALVLAGLLLDLALYSSLGPLALPMLLGLGAGAVIVLPFARHGGLWADEAGLEVRSLMAGRRIPWDRIEQIHFHERRQAICLHLKAPEDPEALDLAGDPRPKPLQFFNWYGLETGQLIAWLTPPGGLVEPDPAAGPPSCEG